MNEPAHPMWKGHSGLVWSNPEAGDTAYLCAALLRPRYDTLLDAALVFGLERLRLHWTALKTDDPVATRRVTSAVERMLANIDRGFKDAAARN